jgi:hypothetical protein
MFLCHQQLLLLRSLLLLLLLLVVGFSLWDVLMLLGSFLQHPVTAAIGVQQQ